MEPSAFCPCRNRRALSIGFCWRPGCSLAGSLAVGIITTGWLWRCLFDNRASPHGENKMTRTFTKQLLSAALSFLLVIGTTPFEVRAQSPPTGSTGYSGQAAPL